MLIGGALAAAPVIIHLLHKRRFRVVRWAAMDFLLASSRKNYRRVRLREIILLVLRTLILMLVVAAMARPFLAGAAAMMGLARRHVVIVVDNSLSMSYAAGGVKPFENAKTFAVKIIDSLEKGDTISLIAVSEQAHGVIREPSTDLEAALAELRALETNHGSTNLPQALQLAREILEKSDVTQKELYLITDNQRTAWRLRDGGNAELDELLTELSPLAEIVVADVGLDTSENMAIVDFRSNNRIIGKNVPDTSLTATIRNFGEFDQEHVEIAFYVDGSRKGSTTLPEPLKAGAAAEVSFGYSFLEAQPHSLSVQLGLDKLPVDDARYLAVEVLESAKVLVVDGRPSSDFYTSASGYLQTALRPQSSDRPFDNTTIYTPNVIQPAELARERLDDYEFIVLADVPRVTPEHAAAIEQYVQDGGSVIIFLGDTIQPEDYNTTLYRDGRGLLPARISGIAGDPRRSSHVSWVIGSDSDHPLLQQFKGPKSSFLMSPQHYQHATLDAPESADAAVVFRYDNGKPALVEKTTGNGRVLLFACSANDSWTDLPRRPGYLLLVQELAAYVVRDRQAGRNLIVGDVLSKTVDAAAIMSDVSVIGPGKIHDVQVIPEGQSTRLRFDQTHRAGLYELRIRRPDFSYSDYFSVNVDPAESDLRRLGPEELRRTFPGFKFEHLAGVAAVETSLREAFRRSDIWKQLLLAALALMCIETVLAQRFGR